MSKYQHSHGIGSEHPRSHQYQLIGTLLVLIVVLIDIFFLKLTIALAEFVPLVLRIGIFILLVILAFILVDGSHKLVFASSNLNPPKVITKGVYAWIRHPMYCAYILGYIGVIVLTMSLISLIPFVIAFLLLNRIAAYEEQELVKILGNEYIEYTKSVPRWIPKVRKVLGRM